MIVKEHMAFYIAYNVFFISFADDIKADWRINLMRKIIGLAAILVALFLCAAGGFLAGIVVNQQDLLPVTGINFPGTDGRIQTTGSDHLDTGLIKQAYDTIQSNYADRETLNKTDMTYSAITGMVDSLGDTGHSRFLTPDMVAEEKRAIEGELEGIGALLNVNEKGNPVILAPMDGSPAQKAGLRPGDIIMAVNGEDVSHASLSEVVDRVTGPAGTQVTLTILNPETEELRDVTITRAKIIIQNVTWQMLPGTKIAHIRVSSFSQDVAKNLKNALTQAQAQGAEGIILDLRNNPGGLLNEAVGVIGQFITNATALQVKDAQGKVQNVPAGEDATATEIPMVVLINQGSASAAEITAGALQDYKRARLVGETTFGTGTVLNQFRLNDGSAILLATELWLTPKGRVIWHKGIKPDIEVKLPADISPSIPETERNITENDLKNLKDVQLKKALEVLQGQIKP
jgi:carboxyl-terminal processing protease